MKVTCNCLNWKTFIPQVDGAISLAWTHGMWSENFKPFKYCPYCGKKLVKDEIRKEKTTKSRNSNK